MKTILVHHLILKSVVLACLVGASAFAHASDKKAAPAKPVAMVVPKSVFSDDPQSGKDPFFPASTRRLASLPRVAPSTNAAPAAPSLFTFLTLKGISGTKDKPLALVNGTTMTLGEKAEVRSGYQIIKVRCLEIRERSVLLELDGSKEIRELKLREGA